MMPKIWGALLIMIGCGGFGLTICMSYKREEEMLRQLIHAFNLFQCELEFRMTPLPDLCLLAGTECKGTIGTYFQTLAFELNKLEAVNVSNCIVSTKETLGIISERVDKALDILAMTLGQFDLQGQLQGLETARNYCNLELEQMSQNRETRLRSYQTLGLCGGAAIVILLV